MVNRKDLRLQTRVERAALKTIRRVFNAAREARGTLWSGGTFANENAVLSGLYAANTAAGVYVDSDTALNYSAVFACVKFLAETIGTLPLELHQKDNKKRRILATKHALYLLLRNVPNPEMSAVTFWELVVKDLCLNGNFYAVVERDKGGAVVALWPIPVACVRIGRQLAAPFKLFYEITPARSERYAQYVNRIDQQTILGAYDVLHIRAFTENGIIGLSPIAAARNAIALGMGAETYGGKFFGAGSTPGGVLQAKEKLGADGRRNLRDAWNEAHQGINNSHSVAVLEQGVEWKATGFSPEDSQFLETRGFQLQEICRIYRVPPHFVGDLSRATFSNVEQQSLDAVLFTLTPWCIRIESELSRSLLTPTEQRAGYYPRYDLKSLLRGDTQTRFAAYNQGRTSGWLSVNEIREAEDLEPIDGGDIYLNPLNMTSAANEADRNKNLKVK